jgi:hypothetical protein
MKLARSITTSQDTEVASKQTTAIFTQPHSDDLHTTPSSRLLQISSHSSRQVIKNQPAYYHQARVEVGILQLLNGRCDPGDCHHIVRLHDAFLHRRHLCLAFEQLGINLFELLKRNGFRGLSLGLLRLFLQQVRLLCSDRTCVDVGFVYVCLHVLC